MLNNRGMRTERDIKRWIAEAEARGAVAERLRIRRDLLDWLIGRIDPRDAGLVNGRRITAEIDRIAPEEQP